MNWVDAIIIVIALIGAYLGYKNGLIRAVFSIVGLVVGVVVAGQWSDSLADKFSPGGALHRPDCLVVWGCAPRGRPRMVFSDLAGGGFDSGRYRPGHYGRRAPRG